MDNSSKQTISKIKKLSLEEETQRASNSKSELDALIEMGSRGIFPIFQQNWMNETYALIRTSKKTFKPKAKDKRKFNEIAKRVAAHSTIQRKQTLLFALAPEDRQLFIRMILSMVEEKILNSKPGLH